jgi:hypothetical protein
MILSDNGNGDYEPIPTGPQQGVCSKVYDLGLQPGYEGKPSHKMVILWELAEEKADGSRHTITKRYTASLNQKAALRADLEAWRGKPFTEEELKSFDTDKLIGINCLLNIVETESNAGKKWANVKGIMPTPKGMVILKPELPADYVPKWVADLIGSPVPQAPDQRRTANQAMHGQRPAPAPVPEEEDVF